MHDVQWTNRAEKDYAKIKRFGLTSKVAEIMRTVRQNPYEPTHKFEKLVGNINDTYSRRIDYHNRFVYEIFSNIGNTKDHKGEPYEGIVKVVSMWGHY